MTLFVYNGSPRGQKSNTFRILEHFIAGYQAAGQPVEAYHLHQKSKSLASLDRLNEAGLILVAFPIYFHSMPGHVKEFLELLPRFSREGQRIVFFMQCGFPETAQCLPMERYLTRWARRNRLTFLGVIIKGFGASIDAMPLKLNAGWLKDIHALGRHAGEDVPFPEAILSRLKDPVRFTPFMLLWMRILARSGMFDLYAKKQMKAHQVGIQESYAQPLLEEPGGPHFAKNEGRRSKKP